MPSLISRSVDVSDRWARAQNGAPASQMIPHFPTPPPNYVSRSPFLQSSIPSIASTQDGALRQFYGGRHLPMRRVGLT
jgi:hypothetical protein